MFGPYLKNACRGDYHLLRSLAAHVQVHIRMDQVTQEEPFRALSRAAVASAATARWVAAASSASRRSSVDAASCSASLGKH